jgi:DNA end-binding protein Ku
MARPIWKGQLSFGLVTIPVVLQKAEEPLAEIDFDMLDSRDLSRIRYKRVNENTGEEVPWNQIVKGHKEDGEYVVLTPEDFKRAGQKAIRGLEIVEFVDRESISPLFFERPYYVLPGKGGEKGYALLRQAMKKVGLVGIAKLVLQSREHLAALMVIDDVMVVNTIRFGDEVRSPESVELPETLEKVKTSPREIDLATKLIKEMTTEWDPSRHKDEYHDALLRFMEEKARSPAPRGRAMTEEEEPPPPTYKIMDLLRQSVEGHPRGRRPRAQTRRTARRAPQRQHVRRKAG